MSSFFFKTLIFGLKTAFDLLSTAFLTVEISEGVEERRLTTNCHEFARIQKSFAGEIVYRMSPTGRRMWDVACFIAYSV